MENPVYEIAIIGGGSAGVMAALRGALNNDQVILFPGTPKNRKKSRAFWVSKVENMPGHLNYKKGIIEPNNETLKQLEDFANFQIIKNGGIQNIARQEDGLFTLTDTKDNTYRARYVVLATGLMDRQPIINGTIKPVLPYANVQLMDYCLRCDGHHVMGKKTSIIGHTNGAAWVAVMLHERYQVEIDVITNGEAAEFDEQAQELLELYQIKVYQEKITDIKGNAKENILEGVTLENEQFIPCEIAFISLGMIIYNELALALNAEVDERGFVITNEKGETNVQNLYAVGDLQAKTKKQIYTAWDTAVDSLDDINAKIRREKRTKLLNQNKGD